MLQLVYLKKKKNRHFITPQHFLLFLCGLIWSLLFKTEVEQMNPSVLTFSCQQCFSVRWNKLPSPFIFYNQLRAAESTHSPVYRPCQHLILCGTGSLCQGPISNALPRSGLVLVPPSLSCFLAAFISFILACTAEVQSLFCKKVVRE